MNLKGTHFPVHIMNPLCSTLMNYTAKLWCRHARRYSRQNGGAWVWRSPKSPTTVLLTLTSFFSWSITEQPPLILPSKHARISNWIVCFHSETFRRFSDHRYRSFVTHISVCCVPSSLVISACAGRHDIICHQLLWWPFNSKQRHKHSSHVYRNKHIQV